MKMQTVISKTVFFHFFSMSTMVSQILDHALLVLAKIEKYLDIETQGHLNSLSLLCCPTTNVPTDSIIQHLN